MRNAFRPQTIVEISQALELAREDADVGAIILTGEGELAFCSGGDQRVRGDTGYVPEGAQRSGRFHVTDLHVQIRRLPKPVVAMVAGYAVGGGQSCTSSATSRSPPTTRASARPARASAPSTAASAPRCWPRRSGCARRRRSGSCAASTTRSRRSTMGLVNTVVPLERLEEETVAWCREMLALSPFALRLLKASFHAAEDGLAGIQQLAHDANLLFYATEEAARAARRTRPSARPTSPSSRGGREHRRGRRRVRARCASG